jgi:hypothetical protein
VEERAWHLGVDEGDRTKKGNDGGQLLLWWPSGTGEEEKGQGVSGFSTTWRKNGEERGGGAGTTWDSSVAGISPWPVGAGGGAVAR